MKTQLTKFQRRRSARLASDEVGVYVGTTWPAGAHGHLLEFGTSKMAAQPFLRPAWDATKDHVLASIAKELWSAIDKAARRAANKAIRMARK